MKVYTHKARKDYPQYGIARGDTYYEWVPYRGRPIKSKTYPKPSRLTSNSTLQMYNEALEMLSAGPINLDNETCWTKDGVESLLNDVAEKLHEAASDAGDKFDNMPEGLQQGETGQKLKEWRDSLESFADELDSLADNVPEQGDECSEDETESDEDYAERLQAYVSDAEGNDPRIS